MTRQPDRKRFWFALAFALALDSTFGVIHWRRQNYRRLRWGYWFWLACYVLGDLPLLIIRWRWPED